MIKNFLAIFTIFAFGCSNSEQTNSGDSKLYFPDSDKRSHEFVNEDPEANPYYVYQMYTNKSLQDIADYYLSFGASSGDFEVNTEEVFGTFESNGVNYQLEVSSSYEEEFRYHIMISYYLD